MFTRNDSRDPVIPAKKIHNSLFQSPAIARHHFDSINRDHNIFMAFRHPTMCSLSFIVDHSLLCITHLEHHNLLDMKTRAGRSWGTNAGNECSRSPQYSCRVTHKKKVLLVSSKTTERNAEKRDVTETPFRNGYAQLKTQPLLRSTSPTKSSHSEPSR